MPVGGANGRDGDKWRGGRTDLICSAYNSPGLSFVDSGTTNLLLPSHVYDAVIKDQFAPMFATSISTGRPDVSVAKVLGWMANLTQCSDWLLSEQEVADMLPSLKVSLLLAADDAGNNASNAVEVEITPWHYLAACTAPAPAPASASATAPKRWRFLVEKMCHPSAGITLGRSKIALSNQESARGH